MRLIDADLAMEQIKKIRLIESGKMAVLLCLSSVPTIAPPPNDQLTLEDLREMDGDPVWVERPGCGARWALVQVWAKSTSIIYLTCNNGMVLHTQPELESGTKIYRRKPEAEPQNSEENRHFIHSPDNEYETLHSAREHFAGIWDSTIKPADHDLYGWAANPWVWVIEFEQISREEANP